VVGALADEVGRGGEPAAIDDDVGAGDVRGLVAGQEQIHSPVPSECSTLSLLCRPLANKNR
jgi:hypothetical protein